MKALQVVPSLALRHGGVSVSVRELSRGLAQLGAEVRIWTTRRGYDESRDAAEDDRLKAQGVEVRYFPVFPWRWLGQRYAYSPSMRSALPEGVGWADVVHIHALWLYPTLAAARTCERLGVPYVLSPCGALDPYSLRVRPVRKWLYGRWVEQRTLREAEALHFTTRLEQQRAWTFGVPCRSAIIPCSLDLQTIPPLSAGAFRSKHPETGSRKILLFLGRLHPKKRLDLAVQAFILLCRRREDLHLVVAGPDEGDAPRARRLLEEAGLLGRATFTGMVDSRQRWELFNDAALFLFPSEDENFGITGLEAMASGVPVLFSAQVGISDAAARAGAGLVPDFDPAAWANAAETLLSQPDRAAAMGQAGRRLAQEEFSTRGAASRLKELYESLLL